MSSQTKCYMMAPHGSHPWDTRDIVALRYLCPGRDRDEEIVVISALIREWRTSIFAAREVSDDEVLDLARSAHAVLGYGDVVHKIQVQFWAWLDRTNLGWYPGERSVTALAYRIRDELVPERS